ncbi:MAG: DUF1993 domain-containing protein [Pseudomonadota bacterium]
MPLTLHEAFVPSCRQILGGVRSITDIAESFAAENSISDEDMFEARLTESMWNLPWHIRACWVHTKLALELVPTGEFSPDFTVLPASWDEMRAMTDEAIAALDASDPEALEAIVDQELHFVLGGTRRMSFTVGNFILSFSQPNFYFHATTFYDILRMKEVPLSKRTFLHAPRIIGG